MAEVLRDWTDIEPFGQGAPSGFSCHVLAYEDIDSPMTRVRPVPDGAAWRYVRFGVSLLYGSAGIQVAHTTVTGVPVGPGAPAGGARTARTAWFVQCRDDAYAQLRKMLPYQLAVVLEAAHAVAELISHETLDVTTCHE